MKAYHYRRYILCRSSMDKIKVAVIGTGLIATRKHLPALRNLKKEYEIAALVDIDIKSGKEIAKKY